MSPSPKEESLSVFNTSEKQNSSPFSTDNFIAKPGNRKQTNTLHTLMGIYKFDALSICHEAPCQLNQPSRYRCVFTSRRKILRSLQRSMLHFCQKGNSKLLSKGVSPPTKNNIHSIYCMNHSRFSSILLHALSLKHHQTLSSSYGKVHFSILSCLGALGYTAIVLHEVSVLDAS